MSKVVVPFAYPLVLDSKDISQLTGVEIEDRLQFWMAAGMYCNYHQGMYFAKAEMDWKMYPGQFRLSYSAETWEEWIKLYYKDKYSVDTKIENYKLMKFMIGEGCNPQAIWEIEQEDQITQTRRHLEKLGKHRSYDKAVEILDIAKQLKREFRQWRKDEEKGKNLLPPKIPPMSIVQQKAWALEQVMKELDLNKATDPCAAVCLILIKSKLREAKTK